MVEMEVVWARVASAVWPVISMQPPAMMARKGQAAILAQGEEIQVLRPVVLRPMV